MQEMNYQEGYRDEPPAAPVYEGVPPPLYNVYSQDAAGQKLKGFVQSTVGGPSAAQRLILAIVSLILWMGMFLFVTFSMVTILYRGGAEIGPKFAISILLIFGMLIFSGIMIFLNVLFSRGKR